MPRCLIITNDFPPRQGGIETFVYEIVRRLSAKEVVVFTSNEQGASQFDAALPFPVVRHGCRTLLPTPGVAARAAALATDYGCDRVLFGAAAPLGLLAGRLGLPSVAFTHGHEVWWARAPGTRSLLRRIGKRVGAMTYLTDYTRARIAPVLPPEADLVSLAPGVDGRLFRPGVESDVRERYGLSDRRVILSVSRLVPRKGQDALIRAMPEVRRHVPDAVLLIVGSGPYESRLRRLADTVGAESVVFAGAKPHAVLPKFFAAADIFAMPCRTRRLGLEVEGLGIVFLEAAAAGLPVLAGDSGGRLRPCSTGRPGMSSTVDRSRRSPTD